MERPDRILVASRGLRCAPRREASRISVARIEIGAEVLDVRATELKRRDRDELYAEQARRYPGFAEYERKSSRVIPVIALAPTGRALPASP